MMEPLTALYLAGLIGALGMDLISPLAERLGYRTGITMLLIGRWFIALLLGRFMHREIRQSPPSRHEALAGWLFHYLIGGGAVALLLLPWLWMSGTTQLPTGPILYILFGLLTSVLPWLILMPAYGWGAFGRNGPSGSRPLIASPLNHLGYGVGIWIAVVVEHRFALFA